MTSTASYVFFVTSLQSSIQWREVSLSETSCELLVESLDTYLFGVAVNAITWAGARISSGIHWNSCVYIKNLSKKFTYNF